MTTDFIDLPSPGQKRRNEPPPSDREKALLDGMREIANWRKKALAYDEDMGNPPRTFCEDMEMVEEFANGKLAAYGKEEGK